MIDRKKGLSILIFILFTIFLPVVTIFMSIALVGGFIFYGIEYLCLKSPGSFIEKAYISNLNTFPKPIFYLLQILRYFLILITAIIYLAVVLPLGTALGVIMILPSYIIYVLAFCRILCYWKKRHLINKN